MKTTAAKAAKPGQVTVFYPRQTNDSELARALRASVEVIIDKKAVGTVEIGKPLTVPLPAGPHMLQVSNQGDPLSELFQRPETAITSSGEKSFYFYVYQFGAGPRLGEVDAVTAQAEITGIVPRNPTGTSTILVYWPGGLLDFGLFDALKSDFPIYIDGKPAGQLTSGDYISVQLSAGRHLLEMETGSLFGTKLKQDLILSAGRTHYFLITKRQYIEMSELPPEQGKSGIIGLRQR